MPLPSTLLCAACRPCWPLARLHPLQTAELPTTNGPWAQGEGLALARSAGASLLHLDQVQARGQGHPLLMHAGGPHSGKTCSACSSGWERLGCNAWFGLSLHWPRLLAGPRPWPCLTALAHAAPAGAPHRVCGPLRPLQRHQGEGQGVVCKLGMAGGGFSGCVRAALCVAPWEAWKPCHPPGRTRCRLALSCLTYLLLHGPPAPLPASSWRPRSCGAWAASC